MDRFFAIKDNGHYIICHGNAAMKTPYGNTITTEHNVLSNRILSDLRQYSYPSRSSDSILAWHVIYLDVYSRMDEKQASASLNDKYLTHPDWTCIEEHDAEWRNIFSTWQVRSEQLKSWFLRATNMQRTAIDCFSKIYDSANIAYALASILENNPAGNIRDSKIDQLMQLLVNTFKHVTVEKISNDFRNFELYYGIDLLQNGAIISSNFSTKVVQDINAGLHDTKNDGQTEKAADSFKAKTVYRQRHNAKYMITLSDGEVIIPPLCTCCLQPTDTFEKIKDESYDPLCGPEYNKIRFINMPLCPDCIEHRKRTKRLSRWLCFWSILSGLIGCVVSVSCHQNTPIALLIGCCITLVLWYILHLIVKSKPLPENHSDYGKSVRLLCEWHPKINQSTSKFTFTNQEYAELFRKTNAQLVLSADSSPKHDPTNKTSVWHAKESNFGSFWGTIGCFALIAIAFTFISSSIKDLTVATNEPAVTTHAATVAPTPRTTATSTNKVSSIVSSFISPLPTEKPVAVYTFNGKVFINPSYEGVCPFTIIADSSTDYYIYLEYIRIPNTSTVDRTLKSSAGYPLESDLAFYLKAGQTVEIDVPIGIYKLYYATGKEFYGTKLLFGNTTHYYSADEKLSFYADSRYYNGHTITLKTVVDGNFDTDPISESEFPKRD